MPTKDTHIKLNEQLFLKQVVIQLPNWKQQKHLFLHIFYFKLQTRTKQDAYYMAIYTGS